LSRRKKSPYIRREREVWAWAVKEHGKETTGEIPVPKEKKGHGKKSLEGGRGRWIGHSS